MAPLFTLLTLLSTAPADLAAVGVIVSARPEGCVAILRSGGRTRVAGLGDAAFGGRVLAISATAVTLEFDGERTELRLSAGQAAGPRSAPAALAAPAGPPENPADSARAMDRREVERRLSEEIPRILAETTLVPVADGPQMVGYTLTRLPEGTLLTDAGLRPGDVLTHLNDVAIDSLPTLVSLWPRLQSASSVRAVVLRNGRPISLTVTLR